jgi:hypothetical protein
MSSPEIPRQQIEVRGVERRFFAVNLPRPGIRDEAFWPGKSGKDNDGLWVIAYRQGVREIIRRNVGDPIEGQDLEHALITGFPSRRPDEGLDITRLCERLAEKLASQSRPL